MSDKKRKRPMGKTGCLPDKEKSKSYPRPQAVRYKDRKTVSGVTFR